MTFAIPPSPCFIQHRTDPFHPHFTSFFAKQMPIRFGRWQIEAGNKSARKLVLSRLWFWWLSEQSCIYLIESPGALGRTLTTTHFLMPSFISWDDLSPFLCFSRSFPAMVCVCSPFRTQTFCPVKQCDMDSISWLLTAFFWHRDSHRPDFLKMIS